MEFHFVAILLVSALPVPCDTHHALQQLLNPCSSLSTDEAAVMNNTFGIDGRQTTRGFTFRTTQRDESTNSRMVLANMYISINEALYNVRNLRSRCTMEFGSRRMCGELRRHMFFSISGNLSPNEDLQEDYTEISKIWTYLHRFYNRRHIPRSPSMLALKNKCREIVCHLKLLIQDAGLQLPPLNDVISSHGGRGDIIIEDFFVEKQHQYNYYREHFSVRNSLC